MDTIDHFTIFARLPPELRLKIYSYIQADFAIFHPVAIPYHPTQFLPSSHPFTLSHASTDTHSILPQQLKRCPHGVFSRPWNPVRATSWEAERAITRGHKVLSLHAPGGGLIGCDKIGHAPSSRREISSTYPPRTAPSPMPPSLSVTLDPDVSSIYLPRPNSSGMGYDEYLRDFTLCTSRSTSRSTWWPASASSKHHNARALPSRSSRKAACPAMEMHQIRSIAIDYLTEEQGRRVWEMYNIACLMDRLVGLREVVLVLPASATTGEGREVSRGVEDAGTRDAVEDGSFERTDVQDEPKHESWQRNPLLPRSYLPKRSTPISIPLDKKTPGSPAPVRSQAVRNFTLQPLSDPTRHTVAIDSFIEQLCREGGMARERFSRLSVRVLERAAT